MAKSTANPTETPHREHFLTATDGQRRVMVSQLAQAAKGEMNVTSAVNFVFGCGYDLLEVEIPQSVTRAVELARTEVERQQIRNDNASRLRDEKQALANWRARRTWASTTSKASDIANKAAADAQAQDDRAAFIARRAAEILDQEERERQTRATHKAAAEYDSRHP